MGGKTITSRSNNFELYFEEDRLDEFQDKILENGFEFIHKIREEPWGQQVFRFYDYDNNIVTIAESMDKTSYRLYAQNKSIEEISKITGLPIDQVLVHIGNLRKIN